MCPVYRVDRDGLEPRVVEAKTPAAARAHVANDEIRTAKIGASDAMRLMAATPGLMLETAGETAESEPEIEPQPEEPDPDRQREDQQERSRLAEEEEGPGNE